MRLHLHLTPSKIAVPFPHLPQLVGTIHKWLGAANQEHDAVSLYSFSWLNGSQASRSGLHFPNGASLFFSTPDGEMLERLIKGVQSDPTLAWGMEVRELVLQHPPEFETGRQIFKAASPVLARGSGATDKDRRHLTFEDAEAGTLLTETLRYKLELAGLPAEGASVYFDTAYPHAKTKVVYYKGVPNKASVCPVVVEGTPEQIAFAWSVGVGQSSGVGFGALGEII